jgi:hypothetical protein
MLKAVVQPHVGTAKRAAAADTLEALDALLSFEAWERLRVTQALSAQRAARVLLAAATALVKS